MKRTMFAICFRTCHILMDFSRYSNHCSSQNGAFLGLDASECFDIIEEVTLGSLEEIAQVSTHLVFSAFKRAIFKI